MKRRLQTVNGDTVLEITEDVPSKRRLSEKTLLRSRQHLTESIAHFQAQLALVDEGLALITAAKNETDTK